MIHRAIKELHVYIETKTKQTQSLEQKLRGFTQLNHRQRAIISHALRHPGHKYTIESHRMSHNVVYQTARTDLLNLEERGLLNVEKIQRTQYFSAAPDLEARLREST